MESPMETQSPSIINSDEKSTGYEIRLCVYPDGTFGVKGPEPLPEDSESTGDLTSLVEAHKAIHDLYKSHPVGGDDQKEFEAGFGGSPAGPELEEESKEAGY